MKCAIIFLLFVLKPTSLSGGMYPNPNFDDAYQQPQPQRHGSTSMTSAGGYAQRQASYGQGPFGDPYMEVQQMEPPPSYQETGVDPSNPFSKPRELSIFAKYTKKRVEPAPEIPSYSRPNPIRPATFTHYRAPPVSAVSGYQQHYQQPPPFMGHPQQSYNRPALASNPPYQHYQHFSASPTQPSSHQYHAEMSNYGPASGHRFGNGPTSGHGSGIRPNSEVNVGPNSEQILALPAPPLPDLLGDEPIPDLLTDSAPATHHIPQSAEPAPTNTAAAWSPYGNSLMDQLSLEHPKPVKDRNLKGTLEVLYTEQTVKNENDKGKIWEIYRQRDNSGNYVKFRHVDKVSGQTQFSCIAPMPNPKEKVKLFFNDNQQVEFTFDSTGYMVNKEEEMALDPFSGWPKDEARAMRKYDYREFQRWIKSVLHNLLNDSTHSPPLYLPANIPSAYPKNLVFRWVKLSLPVHPLFIGAERKNPGFIKLDIKKLDPNSTAALETVIEQFDDGKNWIKIEVAQPHDKVEYEDEVKSDNDNKVKSDNNVNEVKSEELERTSKATFLRDPNGNPPLLKEPIVLFFNGQRKYFAKNGMAASLTTIKYLKEKEEKRKQAEKLDPALEAFLAENRRLLAEEERKNAQNNASGGGQRQPPPMRPPNPMHPPQRHHTPPGHRPQGQPYDQQQQQQHHYHYQPQLQPQQPHRHGPTVYKQWAKPQQRIKLEQGTFPKHWNQPSPRIY